MNTGFLQRSVHRITTAMSGMALPKLLILLFGASFLIHGAVAVRFLHQPIALDDMFQYDMLARSLRNGNGFRWYSSADMETLRPYYSRFMNLAEMHFTEEGFVTAFRAPGYPFFLAFLYLFTSQAGRFAAARLVQAALAAALAPLTALLGQQAGFSRRVCVQAALCVSFYPVLLFYPLGLASENLYILLALVSVQWIHQAAGKREWRWVMLAGLACGLLLLTRSIFAISVIFAGVWLGLFSPRRKKAGVIFLLVAFGICLPWSIRSSFIMRRPAFVENSAGYNLFIGYHPDGDGGFVSRVAILPLSTTDDGERDRVCMEQAILFIHQNPAEAFSRVWVRLVRFLDLEDREFFFFYSNGFLGTIPQPWLTILYVLLVLPWAVTGPLGLVGLWHARQHPLTRLAALFLASYALPHLFIIAEPRFHLAWVPLLMPFSVYGFGCVSKLRVRHAPGIKDLPLVFILIAAAFIFICGFAADFRTLISILSEGGNRLYLSY